ncbi:hypothetical protein BDZ97DRAFT_1787875, partial [Flammula alnicola]
MPLRPARTDPEFYNERPHRPVYTGKLPLTTSNIRVIMDINRDRPKHPFTGNNHADDEHPDAYEPRPPTPPPKEPRKHKRSRKETQKEVHIDLLDQFPTPPPELPIPPLTTPLGRSPELHKGGKLVQEPLLAPHKSGGHRLGLDRGDGQMPSTPHYNPFGPFPVRGGREGVPLEDLLPPNLTIDPMYRSRKISQEPAREAATRVPHQRSASTNNTAFNAPPLGYMEPVKPRAWASPAIFRDESIIRKRPGHQRFNSNPNPPSKDLRAYMTLGSANARYRDGPTAQRVVIQPAATKYDTAQLYSRSRMNSNASAPILRLHLIFVPARNLTLLLMALRMRIFPLLLVLASHEPSRGPGSTRTRMKRQSTAIIFLPILHTTRDLKTIVLPMESTVVALT